MSSTNHANSLRIAARILLVCWAAFWTYFLIANLFDNSNTVPASEQTKGYAFIITGLLIIWSLTILAWRKEMLGGATLVGLGTVLTVLYLVSPPQNMQIQNVLTTAVLLGALPLLAGMLFWISSKR